MNFAMMTDATCGDACWAAREDICRCSCGGNNHGITRTANGVAPVRTRRVKDHRYQLLAVESYISGPGHARIESLRPMEKLESAVNGAAVDAGLFDKYASTWPDTPAWPCILRLASASNVKGWPELAAWRGANSRPYVAWVREDMAHLVADERAPAQVQLRAVEDRMARIVSHVEGVIPRELNDERERLEKMLGVEPDYEPIAEIVETEPAPVLITPTQGVLL